MSRRKEDMDTGDLIQEIEKRGYEVTSKNQGSKITIKTGERKRADDGSIVDKKISFKSYKNNSYFDLNGLRTKQDPREHLIRGINFDPSSKETEWYKQKIPSPKRAPRRFIPHPNVDYRPVELPGGVTSFNEFVDALSRPEPVFLIGDAGQAKNLLINTVASSVPLPTYRCSLGGDTSIYNMLAKDDVHDATSVVNLQSIGKAAVFGGIAIGDELNTLSGDISSQLHATIEEQGKRRVDLPTGRELVDLQDRSNWEPQKHLGKYIHPMFKFVATGNPMNYQGTKKMNHAFLDRFILIFLSYPSVKDETELLVERFESVDKEEAKSLVLFANDLRDIYPKTLKTPISHRRLKMALRYYVAHENSTIADGIQEQIVKYAQDGGVGRSNDRETIRDAISDYF